MLLKGGETIVEGGSYKTIGQFSSAYVFYASNGGSITVKNANTECAGGFKYGDVDIKLFN